MVFIYAKKSPFFNKVPGGYFAIAGSLLFLFFFTVSVILHSLTDPVDWARHFVSNMGIGPNGAAFFFSLAVFLQGILLYPVIIHGGQQLWLDSNQPHAKLNNNLLIVGFIIAMFSVPGLIMIAFFSMAPATIIMHAIGAVLFFFGTILYGGAFWICFELQKRSNWPLRICSIIVIIAFCLFIGSTMMLIIQFPEEFQNFMANPMDYVFALLGNTVDTKLANVRRTEWIFIFSMIAWCFNLAYLSVRDAKSRVG